MRAVRGRSDGQGVEVVEVDERPPGVGEVRVRVASVGICGTDLHLLAGGMLAGRTPGHEIAGFAPDGRAVTVEPLVTCRTCVHCTTGHLPRCSEASRGFIGVGTDGGMSEFVVVPDHTLVEVPSGLDVGNASLVEPTAVAVRGLGLVDLRAGSHVAVVGGGAVGLTAVAAARAMGATVELHARHEHQREAGERLGAEEPSDRPCSLVIDAAGTASSLADAASRCDPGGTILALAMYWDRTELPGIALSLQELRIQPSMMYGRTRGYRDMDLAAGIVAGTPELATAVITDRFPLDAGPEAFARAEDRSGGAIKVVVEA